MTYISTGSEGVEMSVDFSKCEWQMVGQDDWVFGEKIRGVVRAARAQIYYDGDSNNPTGGWKWSLDGHAASVARQNGRMCRGASASRSDAIQDAEHAMGIILS